MISIAHKFGVSAETLRKWVRRAGVDGGHRPGLTTEKRERLKVLERENRELRRANEILKSAAMGSTGRRDAAPRRGAVVLRAEEISRVLAEGVSLRTIASRLKRASSTVSREGARHSGSPSLPSSSSGRAGLEPSAAPQAGDRRLERGRSGQPAGGRGCPRPLR